MNQLTELFWSEFEKVFSGEGILAALFVRKFREAGFIFDENKADQLRIQMVAYAKDMLAGRTVRFELDDEALNIEVPETFKHQPFPLDFTIEEYQEIEESVLQKMETLIEDFTTEVAGDLLNSWKQQASAVLNEEREAAKLFADEIDKRWNKPLHLLDMLVSKSLDLGANFNAEFQSKVPDDGLVFDALTSLHARGCQVAREIFILLSQGFADGAHARWRTLHELAVTASFIREHGNDVAARFLLHADIDIYKEMLLYCKHCAILGLEPLSDEIIEEVTEKHDELIAIFGKDFGKDYGWAIGVISDPNFAEIEKNTGLEYKRPYFKVANSNVHATSKGTMYRLGLAPDSSNLLAGSSIWGLAHPGQVTAHSLTLLTAEFLFCEDGIDGVAYAKALYQLTSEIYEAFSEAASDLLAAAENEPDLLN